MKLGDLIGFVERIREPKSGRSKTRGLFEVTNNQNNDFSVVGVTEGRWRYVLFPTNYGPEYGRINLVNLSSENKFICMDVGLNPGTDTFWCVLLVVEQGCVFFSSRSNELYEVIAEGNPKECL